MYRRSPTISKLYFSSQVTCCLITRLLIYQQGKPYQLAKRRLQEVDAEMSCVEPFVSKEAETRSLEADVVMEPEYQLQPVGALVEGEGLAVR